MNFKLSHCWFCVLLCLLLVPLGQVSEGSTLRQQTVELRKGWNAVFLEVYPAEANPASVFAHTPIDTVASYYEPASAAQFVTNPSADLFRQTGWGVWYSEDRPDAFLKTLHAIHGQQAYLIHAKTDCTLQVTGTVVAPQIQWQPSAFNFVGFSVSPVAGPTFASFFAGSKAHDQNRIYRLVNGTWQRVSDPSAETIRSGEAFWIYCESPSKYQGPLRVDLKSSQGFILGFAADAFTLRNQTDHPVATRVEHVPSGPDPVPLSIVLRAVNAAKDGLVSVAVPKPEGGWVQSIPPLEGGAAIQVPIEARLHDFKSVLHSSLLKISTDLGTEIWIPVIGVREDLQEK